MSFHLALTLVAALAAAYVARRHVWEPAWPPRWRWALLAPLAAGCLLLPATFTILRHEEGAAARPLTFAVWLWLGLLFYLLLLTLGSDLLRLAARLGRRLARRGRGRPDPERRLFLARVRAAGSTAVAASLLPPGLRAALADLRVVELGTPLPRLPGALEGLRVVQLSDLHLGPILGRDFCEEVARRTRALRPDLVVITGDLVDGPPRAVAPALAPLASIEAPQGVFVVTGNHECYSGARRSMETFAGLGLRVLANQRVSVGDSRGGASLDLAGIHDHRGARFGIAPDLPAALRGRDPERALLLLAHQPIQVLEAAGAGVGLQLSGHTHGGQLWPFGGLTSLAQPYLRGLHRHGPETWIYVSSGTGFWGPPMRIGAPAEITLHHLVEAGPES